MTYEDAMEMAGARLTRALAYPEGSASRMNEAQLAAALIAYAKEIREGEPVT